MKSTFLLIVAILVQFCISNILSAQDRPKQGPLNEKGGPPNFFAIGAAASAGQVEFEGGSFQINAFPFINFRQGRFYSNQAGLGYEVIKDDRYRLSFVAEVGINEQNRNDVGRLNDMENLGLPIYGGVALDVDVSDIVLTGTVQRELGFASEGWRATAAISRPFSINRKLSLAPSVTLQWSDDKLTNYLYGVSLANQRAGRAFYRAGDRLAGQGSTYRHLPAV